MNSMITSLTPIDRSQAELLLSEHLHGNTARDNTSVDCALLRSCVWVLSRATAPVHTSRILNLALSLWESEEEVSQRREQLRTALEELSDAGDLVSLPEGRWLPAPTREVLLEKDSDERLLVGGLPTSVLPKELRCHIVRHHGPYRRVRGPSLGEILKLPQEDVDSWAGIPVESLETWSQRLLGFGLTPYNEPPDGSRLHFYIPELATDTSPQAKRWFERPPEAISGRYLAARDRIFGVREYCIVELKKGAVVAIGNFLAPGDGRRLMYALDIQAKKPAEVQVRATHNRLAITLRSELPRSEQRLFAALGILEVPEGRYYPRIWRFAERHSDIVLSRLHNLGVKVVETKTRRLQS